MKQLLCTLMICFFVVTGYTQTDTKTDIIEKLNGDEISVKITEVGDDIIKFTYPGETVSYTLKKSEIFKIKFSSGRVEVFNKPAPAGSSPAPAGPPATGTATPASADHSNKIAILPISMLRDGQATSDAVGLKIQNEVYTYMQKHSGTRTVLDPRTTNALLIKAGITNETIRGHTMDEIGDILGVEYLVEGIVTMNQAQQTSTSTTQYDTKTKNDPKKNNTNYNTTKTSNSSTEQTYETRFSLSIYDDKGKGVFNQERKSFFDGQNAYRNAMEYLLKRTPLYTK